MRGIPHIIFKYFPRCSDSVRRLFCVNSHASILIQNVSLIVPVYDLFDTEQHIQHNLLLSNATGTWYTVKPSQATGDPRTKHPTDQVFKASSSFSRVTRRSVCISYYHKFTTDAPRMEHHLQGLQRVYVLTSPLHEILF